jgi:hypothetical protein
MQDYPWSAAYTSAVLETDSREVAEKVDRAERAIRERGFRGSQIGLEEQWCIDRTIAALKALRAERVAEKQPGRLESPVWIVRRRKPPVGDLFGSVC